MTERCLGASNWCIQRSLYLLAASFVSMTFSPQYYFSLLPVNRPLPPSFFFCGGNSFHDGLGCVILWSIPSVFTRTDWGALQTSFQRCQLQTSIRFLQRFGGIVGWGKFWTSYHNKTGLYWKGTQITLTIMCRWSLMSYSGSETRVWPRQPT